MPKSQFIDPKFIRSAGKITFSDIPVNQYSKTVADERKNYSDDDLVRMYRDITVLREFETMLNSIKTQGNYNGTENKYPGPAHLSLGQEASAVGEASALTLDDYIFGSHRSHSEILAKGLASIWQEPDDKLYEIMKNFLGGRTLDVVEKNIKTSSVKELAKYFLLYGTLSEIFARDTGFHKGLGGSMHAFFLPFGIYPNNAIVGGSAPVATGAALYKKVNSKPGIVVANIGDGSIGCGVVYESMNFAAMDQFKQLWEENKRGGLPILFNVFDNGYGMGGQTRGETMAYDFVARLGAGIDPAQMHAERVDGFNPLAVADAVRRKKELLVKGEGPVLLDVVTYRFGGHSPSDANAYRTKEEIAAWQEYDPVVTYRKALVEAGIAKDDKFDEIWEQTRKDIDTVCKLATDEEKSPFIAFDTQPDFVEKLMFSNEKVEKFDDRDVEVLAPIEECPRVQQIAGKERFWLDKDGKPASKIKAYNLRDGIFEAIVDRYYKDPTLTAYGEECREWGGAFAVYRGLADVLPYSRLFNSPISEAAIVSSAVGYALSGGRVIVELMYADFIGRAGDEIFNQLAKWQAMSAGILKMPVVLRVSVGSKYGAQHSQDWVSLPAHIPGLKVCFPATPYEAKGLMCSALAGTDPVVFFESQRLYDMPEKFHEGGVPEGYYEIEIGDVNKVRDGKDVTLITIGATLYKAIKAADTLKEKYGVECDILNLHSIVPLNYEKIVESVKKTGRVVLASDAVERGNILNTIAQNISEMCFDYLDAPPVVLGARNWITPPFEYDKFYFPQDEWIIDAIHEKIMPLAGYTQTTSANSVEMMRRSKLGV